MPLIGDVNRILIPLQFEQEQDSKPGGMIVHFVADILQRLIREIVRHLVEPILQIGFLRIKHPEDILGGSQQMQGVFIGAQIKTTGYIVE